MRPSTRPRPDLRFAAWFLVGVAGAFALLSWRPVNDHVVEPFTAGIAAVAGAALDGLGQGVRRDGVMLANERFAVSVRNGCNGVEAMVILLAAVVAFPVASLRQRAAGVLLGIVVIQAVNLVRVVALFLTGSYFPDWFDASHQVIWQSVVILTAVGFFLLWARAAARRGGAAPGG